MPVLHVAGRVTVELCSTDREQFVNLVTAAHREFGFGFFGVRQAVGSGVEPGHYELGVFGGATGLGARYRILFRIGAAEIGGLIEIVEWDEPRDLAWTSVLGIDQRGRWRLRELPGGRTRVELRMAYGVAGAGLSGWLAKRVGAPSVARHLRRSLAQLRRMIEHEQLRERAAARRRAANAA